MYHLKIHKKALKFLKSRNSSERNQIETKLEFLKEDPISHPQLDVKKMKGVENTFRLRIGRIRIIYLIINDELLILVISAGVRGEIYKK